MKRALYLSGGGARAAYQAGVLKAISEITKSQTLPLQILSSVSAGAINAAFLAMHADDFAYGVQHLTELWSDINCEKIFRSGNWSLIKSVMRNIYSAISHSDLKGGSYLLDTTPLKNLLEVIDFKKINHNIEQRIFSDFEVATTCYDVHGIVSFFNSSSQQPAWRRVRHISKQTKINLEHILATTALPLFFPTTKIGNLHYGDGSIRLNAPLRASVRLGAQAILIISNRQVPKPFTITEVKSSSEVSFANVLGNMLNALFLDNVDRDLETLNKINESLKLISQENLIKANWHPIKALHIYPSTDLGEIAKTHTQPLPLLLRYLLSAFGTKAQSGDLISFLLFEAEFCKKLIDLGYKDGLSYRNQIKEFFED